MSAPDRVTPARDAPDRYRDWKEHLFEAPECLHAIPMLQVELVRCVAHLFRHLGTETAGYDNEQVRGGLEYVFYQQNSDICAAIRGSCCPLDERLACLRAAASIYPECFETRCEPILLHRRETYGDLLSSTCYMLWDVWALLHWEEGRDVVLDVLQAGLRSPNPACIESALHGLGHLSLYEKRVASLIDVFLARRESEIRPELVAYAHAARHGRIQ